MNTKFGLGSVLLAGLLWVGGPVAVQAIESPSYKVQKKSGSFELRVYPTMTTAATRSSGSNSGFNSLFKFISGENKSNQKIAMTSPVFMPGTSTGKTQQMMFVMPKENVKKGVPAPSASNVYISTISGGKFAVIRESGRMSDSKRKAMLVKLKAQIKAQGLVASGNPIYAEYNPPWTPGPARRNEVMLRVK